MNYLGDFAAGATVYVPFHTFNAAGASVTISGFAVTDVEVYKNGSVTQRASDSGVTLLDTDGTDFDGITGVHGFSINTGDNADAGFFSSGADYMVVVSAVTVDSQTVNFIAATFSIENRAALRPTVAGRTLDVSSAGNAGIDLDNVALTNGSAEFGIVGKGTLSGTHSTTTADLGTNAPAVDITGCVLAIPARGLFRYIDSYDTGTGVATFSPATSATLANADVWYVYGAAVGSTSALPQVNAVQVNGVAIPSSAGRMEVNATHAGGTAWNSGAIGPSTLAADTITAAKVAADAVAEIQSGLATAAALGVVDDFLDTEIASIISSLNTVAGYLDTEVAAIKAKTDNLPADPADASEIATSFTQLAIFVSAILAILDDPRGEPNTSDPGVEESLAIKIDYLYKAWRNRSTQTATTYALYNDDGVTIGHQAPVSDNGTTFERGVIVTG